MNVLCAVVRLLDACLFDVLLAGLGCSLVRSRDRFVCPIVVCVYALACWLVCWMDVCLFDWVIV